MKLIHKKLVNFINFIFCVFKVIQCRGYSSTCGMIMHTRVDQLLSQLLDSLDTLLSYYRHIANSHEEV